MLQNVTENKVDGSRGLGYSGIMTDISKAIDLTYLRGQVVALLKLSNNIQATINKLEEEIKKGENDNNNI